MVAVGIAMERGLIKHFYKRPHADQILVLRDYLDLSYAEIAAVLDVAPGTVMSRLHRARMALKTELESGND